VGWCWWSGGGREAAEMGGKIGQLLPCSTIGANPNRERSEGEFALLF